MAFGLEIYNAAGQVVFKDSYYLLTEHISGLANQASQVLVSGLTFSNVEIFPFVSAGINQFFQPSIFTSGGNKYLLNDCSNQAANNYVYAILARNQDFSESNYGLVVKNGLGQVTLTSNKRTIMIDVATTVAQPPDQVQLIGNTIVLGNITIPSTPAGATRLFWFSKQGTYTLGDFYMGYYGKLTAANNCQLFAYSTSSYSAGDGAYIGIPNQTPIIFLSGYMYF
ncbi:MAG: hypothetical protein WBC07_08580 [Methylotenera sp.]